MSWIESHQSLSTHRKTIKAARLLKCDKHKLIGHLHELWWWGLDNADDIGLLAGIERTDLALAAQWKSDPEAFAVVLIESGFVDVHPTTNRLLLHDWWDYAGKLNTQRGLRKESNRVRQQRYRAKPVTPNNAVTNAGVTRDTPVTPCDSNQPTVPTNLTNTPPTPSDQEGGEVCVSGVDLGAFGNGPGGPQPQPPRVPVLPEAAPPRTDAEATYADFEARFRDGNGGHFGDKSEAGRAWFDYVTRPGHDPAAVVASLAGYLASSEYADQRSRGLARIRAAKWLAQWTDWRPKAQPKPRAPRVMTLPDGTEVLEEVSA